MKNFTVRLAALAVFVAWAGSACGDDPVRRSLTGHWVGTVALFDESWTIDMAITQNGPSVSGTATRSTYANVPYVVTGDLVGDSLFLHFMPPEDIDLRFALRTENNRLAGVMWFGTLRPANPMPITLNRQ